MNPEWVWEHPWRSRIVIGVVGGILLALLVAPMAGFALACAVALVLALVTSGFSVVIRWKIWPEGRRLRPADRATAVRAVFRGEDVGEDQLAPAVAELARFVMKSAERSRRQRWGVWVIAAITVASAVGASLSGPVLQAIVWWVYVGFWAWILLWLPGRSRRDEACAVRARLLALDRMAGSNVDAGDG